MRWRWHLKWIGVPVFVIAMTLTSATVGGAIVGGCAALSAAEDNAMAREEGSPGDPSAPEAARSRMSTVGFVSTGLLTLFAVLVALRVPAQLAGLFVLPAAAAAGACNAVVTSLALGGWPRSCSEAGFAVLITGVVGAPFGLLFGAALALPTHFARWLIVTGTRAELERSLFATGCVTWGSLFLATRGMDLAPVPTALALGIGLGATAGSVGSYVLRQWRMQWMRDAPIELRPVEAVDASEATRRGRW